MYLDSVRYNDSGRLWFRGTPEQTKAFLENSQPSLYEKVHVTDGETLTRWTVEDYLRR